MLTYPSHWLAPEDLLSFIELRCFTRRWDRLKLCDLDLQALQLTIMASPNAGDLIEGTGGLRKLRFSPPGWAKGKSGALRICYAYFCEVATVVLALVYAKGEKDDIGDDEKPALRAAIKRVEQKLLSNPYRVSKPSATDKRTT